MIRRAARAAAGAALLAVALPASAGDSAPHGWTAPERALIESLWLGARPPLPPDPSNRVADDPRAARFGHALFFDARLSSNGKVACATCHRPELAFTDGLALARGVGTAGRSSMPVTGTAYSPWLFWDGRTDSQWAQALGPLESAVEHGGDRTRYAHVIAGDPGYRTAYESLFGALPDLANGSRFPAAAGPVQAPAARAAWDAMRPEDRDAVTRVFANLGKAIAAYERLLQHGPSRFDRYVEALRRDDGSARHVLDARERAGLRLFVGRAQCARCHNGPLLTNDFFHNTGIGGADARGRADAVHAVSADAFNCTGPYSDAGPRDCAELRFMKRDDPLFLGAFRTPSLRDVARTAPYMHAGQLATLPDVLRHYNAAPPAALGASELEPLGLTPRELGALEAFLRTLDSPPAIDGEWLRPPGS